MRHLLYPLFLLIGIVCYTPCPAQVRDVNTEVRDLTLDSLRHMRRDASPYARPVAGSSRRGQHPVLFLVGNSTMRTGTKGNGSNGQWGWGAFLQQWFDDERLTVENHALGGTSSRTFYRRLWADVLTGVQPGDYVIVELGHNDNGPYDTGRARASIPGIDADTVLHIVTHGADGQPDGTQEDVYSYGEYLRRFVRDIRSHGATPILASLTPRNAWDNDTTILRKWDTFTPWSRAVAAEMGCLWLDLEGYSARRLEAFGHWKTDCMFYYVDRIHTSRFGAQHNAYSAALAIRDSHSPLAQYLRDLTPPHVAVTRRAGRPVVWLCGDSTGQNQDSDEDGMWGWGSVAPQVFDTLRFTFCNQACAGRSSRTFITEGRWDRVYHSLQPGDVVLLQFGHNDTGDIDRGKERAAIALGTDSTHVYRMQSSGEYEAVYSFGWYLKKMIQDTRERGAIPVLLSLTPRNEWPHGKIERRNQNYGLWYRQVVEATGVSFIDVHNLMADHLDALGREEAASYYCHDHTHLSKRGALLVAKLVSEEMQRLGEPTANSR